jgi:hypothetical protein
MAESIINYACRVQDKRQGVTSATIERLVIVAKSDLPMEARRRLVAELGLK